jgi:alpha-ketoglutarate-dependent taurine dioxygenase
MKYERIAVHPISSAIGAVIGGVDLTHLEAETYSEIYHAFLELWSFSFAIRS